MNEQILEVNQLLWGYAAGLHIVDDVDLHRFYVEHKGHVIDQSPLAVAQHLHFHPSGVFHRDERIAETGELAHHRVVPQFVLYGFVVEIRQTGVAVNLLLLVEKPGYVVVERFVVIHRSVYRYALHFGSSALAVGHRSAAVEQFEGNLVFRPAVEQGGGYAVAVVEEGVTEEVIEEEAEETTEEVASEDEEKDVAEM